VAVAVGDVVSDKDACVAERVDELRCGEPLLGMSKEVSREPAVLGHVVILEQELSARTQHSGDLRERGAPIGDVMHGGEIDNDIKRPRRIG
jgi:hypothetical protein